MCFITGPGLGRLALLLATLIPIEPMLRCNPIRARGTAGSVFQYEAWNATLGCETQAVAASTE